MRYYSIVLTNPTTGKVIRPPAFASLNLPATYTSFVNGRTLPGALNVELDVPVSAFAQPMGNAQVTIWGVSLAEIGQSTDLNGAAISVYAGMQKGLPLANPRQSGLILQGYVFQAFGNWVGTDQTLDLVVSPVPTTKEPPNIVLDWKKGTPLSQAIANTLSAAYPDQKQNISISPNLVLANDEPGFYRNLTEFAQFVKSRSIGIVGGDYQGVDILLTQDGFAAYDGTTQAAPKQLEYQDMIGQPTWIDPSTVQSKWVMRADLSVGGYVKFPKSPVVSSAASTSPFVNQKLTFQGSFLISRIRHVGNFRQADASSWVTVVDASAIPVAA